MHGVTMITDKRSFVKHHPFLWCWIFVTINCSFFSLFSGVRRRNIISKSDESNWRDV